MGGQVEAGDLGGTSRRAWVVSSLAVGDEGLHVEDLPHDSRLPYVGAVVDDHG